MVLVVAEAGLNHNGSVDLAHQLIDAAADAGVDAVKFQCYRTEDFISDRTLLYNGEPQFAMFKVRELFDEAWPELRAHCRERGLKFGATPTSLERLTFLLGLNPDFLKNGSDFLLHTPLIRAMARTGLPTYVSTGMATRPEVDAAVRAFLPVAGSGDLTLLHCTSTYPTVAADVNLRRIPLEPVYPTVAYGLSDHTYGVMAAIGAVARGATVVEKHITTDRSLPGPDHHFSADPEQLRELVQAVREMELMLGDPQIGPTESEQQSRRDYRVTPDDTGVYLRRGAG